MDVVTLHRTYELECAHALNLGLPEDHRCRRLHGHRYVVTLWIRGEVDENGVLIEYGDLDTVVAPILRLVDHWSLNDVRYKDSSDVARRLSDNPTVERFALWLSFRLEGLIRSAKADGQRMRLKGVSVQEDSRSGATWEADLAFREFRLTPF